jgi:hypothetical protein
LLRAQITIHMFSIENPEKMCLTSAESVSGRNALQYAKVRIVFQKALCVQVCL